MADVYLPTMCRQVSIFNPSCCCGISDDSRIAFDEVDDAPYEKQGIRHHHFIVAFVLQLLFGAEKIIEVKDGNEKIYFFNRGSLEKWIRRNDTGWNEENQDMAWTSEHILRSCLRDILLKKISPTLIKINDIKTELRQYKIIQGRAGGNIPAVQNKISELDQELNQTQQKHSEETVEKIREILRQKAPRNN